MFLKTIVNFKAYLKEIKEVYGVNDQREKKILIITDNK